MSSTPDAGYDPVADRATSSQGDPGGVADLLGRLSDQITTLLRQEVELAKVEAKQEARTAAKAGAGFAAAGLAGFFTLLFLSFAAAWGLAELVPAGIAFVVIGVIYALITAVLLQTAKKKSSHLDADLPQTKASMQATANWAKDKTS